jgi:uncharacterized protein YybS (DUF2232 family)
MAQTIGGGLFSATLVLLPLMQIPSLVLLSCFTSLPFFLLGLRYGLQPLIGAGLVATLTVFLFEGPLLTTEFFLFSFLGPTFLVHRALMQGTTPSGERVWSSPSALLRDFTLLAGIIMIVALGVYLSFFQENNVQPFIRAFLQHVDPQALKDVEPLLATLFSFLPGFFTFSWMLLMVLNASVAQGILVRFNANLRPTPSFKAIQLPKNFLIAVGLSLALAFIGVGTLELLGKNAALVLSFPFFLTGLGIVHYLFHKTSFAKVGLTLFYCALLLFLWPALFVIFLGLVRPWIEKPHLAK